MEYRISKRRLTLLILIIIILTWFLVLLPATNIVPSPLSFPWYQQPHPSFTTNSTSFVWTNDNNRSLEDMLAYAKQYTQHILPQQEDGIPGSALTTKEQVISFRNLVQCWTQQGNWQYHSTSSVLPHFQDPLYGRCDRQWQRQHKDNPFLPPRPATQYQWRPPAHCPLVSDTIHTTDWCDILHGRHMLLVGDLVQYQLHDLLLDALREGPTVCYGELNCKDHTICSRPRKARLRYIRNDILSKRKKVNVANGQPKVDVVEWPFLGPLSAFKIVLLNRSPVMEDDMTFVQQLAATMVAIRKIQPSALILYRSSFIGHPFCDEAQQPYQLGTTHRQQLPFGWSEYQRRNLLAQAVVEQAGGVYLDMAYSLDQQPDGHIGGSDCLRYCMPGPLDSWALLFYNVFLALGVPY
ncbi:uncharacterized protein BX664DRAFT_271668 [Halteromyces radiatus]|uniref:uncharacterized protein n=1 Tax=Halteromyces radiatus TaxID=101107 RepID=UPI00221E9E03|nr:uncharacterized protein BX664DRAFT_271668 [Halteromyces radiatus]KAI8098821.1 hypothetical protein BX664DRAFT_271668 [Halteromyces radiatus]